MKYLINPLYAGDISLKSKYVNNHISYLVYDLDEDWEGDLLIAGINVFVIGLPLAEELFSANATGFTIEDMEINYWGDKKLPIFKRLIVKANGDEKNDISATGKIGQLAISEKAFAIISKYVNTNNLNIERIYPNSKASQTNITSSLHNFIIIVEKEKPLTILDVELQKKIIITNDSRMKLIVNNSEIYISTPYIECLSKYDCDKHSNVDIVDPHFLIINGNDLEAILSLISTFNDKFYIGTSLEQFFEFDEFKNHIQ